MLKCYVLPCYAMDGLPYVCAVCVDSAAVLNFNQPTSGVTSHHLSTTAAVDFSECRSEEVMSLLTLSVYIWCIAVTIQEGKS